MKPEMLEPLPGSVQPEAEQEVTRERLNCHALAIADSPAPQGMIHAEIMRCMVHTGCAELWDPDVVILEEAMQMDPTAGDMMRVLAHLVAPRSKMRQ